MSQENLKDLREMIKALYPTIYIVSYEEKRIKALEKKLDAILENNSSNDVIIYYTGTSFGIKNKF